MRGPLDPVTNIPPQGLKAKGTFAPAHPARALASSFSSLTTSTLVLPAVLILRLVLLKTAE